MVLAARSGNGNFLCPNTIAFHTGTNFWKGNQFVREGESKALEGEEASLASHIVSEFAHAVDRSEESGAESIGHHLRTEFAKV